MVLIVREFVYKKKTKNKEKNEHNFFFPFFCMFFDANLVWMERSCRDLSTVFFFNFWSYD